MDVDVDGAPNAYGPPGAPALDTLLDAHYLNRADNFAPSAQLISLVWVKPLSPPRGCRPQKGSGPAGSWQTAPERAAQGK
jgi:hypothetical protein